MKYAADIYRVPDTDAALMARQMQLVGRSHVSADQPSVRLDDGRWIVDCVCGSGAGVTPRGTAFCMLCGAQMRGLQFPGVLA